MPLHQHHHPQDQQFATMINSILVGGSGLSVAGSLSVYVEPRYAAQIAPLQWILEAAAVVMVVRAVAERVRPNPTA